MDESPKLSQVSTEEKDNNHPKSLDSLTEREKWNADLNFKEREIALKERDQACREAEIELKRKEHAASGWKNPLVVAIMAAAVAAAGNAAVTITNGNLQRELEDQKSEQARILEMIKTGDPDKGAENLKFLLESGLISNPTLASKLNTFLIKRTPGSGPTLPASSESPIFQGSSLSERIKVLPKQPVSTTSSPNSKQFTVKNHILLNSLGIPVNPVETVNRGAPLKELKLIVLHFTGIDVEQATLKWFTNAQANASAHIVINRDGKMTQLVPFDIRAWHAGASQWRNLKGLNSYSIGIDFINGGQLQKQNGTWVSFSGKVYPPADVFEYKDPNTGVVTGWHQYTEQQIQAAIQTITALKKAYPSIEDVVGHSEITGKRKLDPGPAFPIEQIRSALTASSATQVKK